MNSDRIALALAVGLPVGFWVFDILVKVLGSFPNDDIGVDLCLFGVSFNGSTLLTSAMSSRLVGSAAPLLSVVVGGSLIISLIIYMFGMILVAPNSDNLFARIRWLRNLSQRVGATVFLGVVTLVMEIVSYLFMLHAGDRP